MCKYSKSKCFGKLWIGQPSMQTLTPAFFRALGISSHVHLSDVTGSRNFHIPSSLIVEKRAHGSPQRWWWWWWWWWWCWQFATSMVHLKGDDDDDVSSNEFFNYRAGQSIRETLWGFPVLHRPLLIWKRSFFDMITWWWCSLSGFYSDVQEPGWVGDGGQSYPHHAWYFWRNHNEGLNGKQNMRWGDYTYDHDDDDDDKNDISHLIFNYSGY